MSCGWTGREMRCSSLNHLPKSTSLQRREQNGPNGLANQSPDFLHVGHLTFFTRFKLPRKQPGFINPHRRLAAWPRFDWRSDEYNFRHVD
jgi:hypothetical protein